MRLSGKGNRFCIWVDPTQSTWDAVDTVIHESVHIFQGICRYIGEEEPSDEWAAYTTAYVATELLKDYYALHEEWKKGLQAGEPAIQLEAGTEEESK